MQRGNRIATTTPINFRSVDEYIASLPETAQQALERVRKVIRKVLPEAVESISYNMPTYTMRDATLLHVAAWKSHYSIFAATTGLLRNFQDDLRPYKVGKGTIRFPLADPVPEALIARIATFRVQEMGGLYHAYK